MKKKLFIYSLTLCLGFSLSLSFSSCKTKEGCKIEDSLKAPVNRKGQLKTKKGDSNLFSKNSRKKMKKKY